MTRRGTRRRQRQIASILALALASLVATTVVAVNHGAGGARRPRPQRSSELAALALSHWSPASALAPALRALILAPRADAVKRPLPQRPAARRQRPSAHSHTARQGTPKSFATSTTTTTSPSVPSNGLPVDRTAASVTPTDNAAASQTATSRPLETQPTTGSESAAATSPPQSAPASRPATANSRTSSTTQSPSSGSTSHTASSNQTETGLPAPGGPPPP